MAVIGTATLNVVPKFTGLSKAVNSAFSGVSTSSAGTSAGKSYASSFGASLTKSGVIIGAVSALATQATGAIVSSLSSAISRFDTLNNYPKVMETLGYQTEVVNSSLSTMDERLQGLPTSLDSMVGLVQGLTATTGDLELATNAGLALNDMLLASGSSTQLVSAATEQFRQMLSKGKPDMQDWKSLTQAMPGQMNQLAEAMLGTGATANDLYTALGGGGAEATITTTELLNAMIKLDQEGGDGISAFAEQAKTATGGVATSMANLQTAITRGLANTLEAIGKDTISDAFTGLKDAINSAFKVFNSVVSAVMPAIKTLMSLVGQFAPQLAVAAAAFVTYRNVLPPVVSRLKELKLAFGLAKAGAGTLTESLNACGFAFNPMTIGIAAASVAVGVGVGLFSDLITNLNNTKKATTGLDAAISRATGLDTYAGKVSDIGVAADDSVKSIAELNKSAATLADNMNSRSEEAETQIGQLNTAQSIINDYIGQTDLNTEAQGKLSWALGIVNDALGTSISSADIAKGTYTDQEGAVKDLTSSLNDYITTKKKQIRLDALEDNYSEAVTWADNANKSYKDALSRWDEYYNEGLTTGTGAATSDEYARNYADAQVRKYADAAERANAKLHELEGAMGDVITGEQALSYETLKTASDMQTAIRDWGTALGDVDITEFTEELAEAGVSTETLNAIGSDNLAQLASNCNGNIDVMVWAIKNYNATPLVDKDGTVHLDDTELIDANGDVVVWNGTELVYKETGAVVNDASLLDAQGNVWTWNGTDLYNKDGAAVISGNMAQSNAQIAEYRDTPADLGTKTGNVNIFKNIFESVTSWFSGNAKGGIRLNAAGGIRYHANGAVIAHKAVPLDIVGEDGAEAIVPLTNRRYSQPFIDMLADGVNAKSGAVNNYYTINNLDYIPDSQVAGAVENLFSTLAQTRKMAGRTAV